MKTKYVYGRSVLHDRHKKKYKRLSLFTKLVTVVVVFSAAAVGYDVVKSNLTSQTVTTSLRKIERVAAKRVISSEYFQFETNSDITPIEKESTPTTYVYRMMRGPNIEHELKIFVNTATTAREDGYTTHVLPVDIANNRLVAGTISDHCRTSLPKKTNLNPQKIWHSEVDILCIPDSPKYLLSVGVKRGNTAIKLKRPNGSDISYQIIYRNLTYASPGIDLAQIINTFEAK